MVLALTALLAVAGAPTPLAPLHRTIELARGESAAVTLSDGKRVQVTLVDLEETPDALRSAVRRARVKVRVDDRELWLESGNYALPVETGAVQIDCTVTSGYRKNPDVDRWGLGATKDARLRLWPARSPLVEPRGFAYPLKQRWFATQTQMGNEPSYVDGPESILAKRIYYHSGCDIGGAEGLTEVVAAASGLVAAVGDRALPGYEATPVAGTEGGSREGMLYVLDARGWYHRYAHLKTIDVQPGQKVKMGQRLGLLGKEGSTLWSHLHYDIWSRQPSGTWGVEEAYPLLWDSYRRQYRPRLVANARPHGFVAVGQPVTLDGRRSFGVDGGVRNYRWTLTDGSTFTGPTVERRYTTPGVYSEVLEVTDVRGAVDHDFAVVQVADNEHPQRQAPAIHASYHPTFDVRPGTPVTFKVLTFNTTAGQEKWDFGDGSAPVTVVSGARPGPREKQAYAETAHRFEKPGQYIVRVERIGLPDAVAVTHLQVRVEAPGHPARP